MQKTEIHFKWDFEKSKWDKDSVIKGVNAKKKIIVKVSEFRPKFTLWKKKH